MDYYPVGPQPIGAEVIALAEFGGELGDRPGAVLRVDGWNRVFVLRTQLTGPGAAQAYAMFQDAVRQLALVYDFSGRSWHGPIDIVWKPKNNGTSTRYDEPGEPVGRVI